jgi:hypothetical protein
MEPGGNSFGVLTGRPSLALQTRAAFLGGKAPYHLYYWEVIDAHQLLQSGLKQLSSEVGVADAFDVPTTTPARSTALTSTPASSTPKIHQRIENLQSEILAEEVSKMSKSLTSLAESQLLLVQERKIKRLEARKDRLANQASNYNRMLLELDESNPKRQKLEELYSSEVCRINMMIASIEDELEQ